MPKFADNKYRIEGSMWLIAILGLFFLSACSPSGNVGVDKLNGLSYSYHYRNLDSVRSFALEALSLSESAGYASGMAEAYNNLVFADIAAMDYEKAYARLDSVGLLTDNQVELLVADVQYMRLCQRESRNKDFYDYRERAVRRIKRIEEEKGRLTDRMAGRYAYAKTEFLIVCSTYYYYVGLTRQSSEAMMLVEPLGGIQADTAQYVNYLYQIGSGGILGGGADSATAQKEFERLLECYVLAKRGGLVYWQANSLQAISEHLLNGDGANRLITNNKAAMVYLNDHGMPDSLLAGYLSQRALDMFKAYGDVYQIAGAYRTLSRCYFELGDYRSSLICLENALADSAVNKAPAQVASIRECMSIVYSAMGDKNNSDINRNIYLDIQEYTRQDRQLEARAGRLERASAQLNVLIVSVLALILSAVVLLFVFRRLGRRQTARSKVAGLLSPLSEWEAGNRQSMARLDDECCDVRERLASALLVLDKYKRRSLDNKAKVFLVDNVVPYIDRMINEVRRIDAGSDSETVIKERYIYMAELAGKIGEYNAVLTHWIQLQQGQLGLHITSFNLKDVFGVVAKSATSFKLKGISLDVEPVDVVVKADKVLTLFMLNTLADNARKFTPEGGRVCISAAKAAEYKLLVDFHGSYPNEGMRRKYPNLMTREGVLGLEYDKWSDKATVDHDVTIPFIRMWAGPMDYTPGAMLNAHPETFWFNQHEPMSQGTRSHQLAMYVVYESPLQMVSDSPSKYDENPESFEFIKATPTVWDETIGLCGEPGEYVAMARRSGDKWFVGVMNGSEPHSIEIPLGFLGDGDWTVSYHADGVNAASQAKDFSVGTSDVCKDDVLKVDMARGGGYMAIISRK